MCPLVVEALDKLKRQTMDDHMVSASKHTDGFSDIDIPSNVSFFYTYTARVQVQIKIGLPNLIDPSLSNCAINYE